MESSRSQSPFETILGTVTAAQQEPRGSVDHVFIPQPENEASAAQDRTQISGDPNFQGLPASIFNTPTDIDFRDLGIDFNEPAWLPASFDVAALNDSISSTIYEWGNPNSDTTYAPDQRLQNSGVQNWSNHRTSNRSDSVNSIQQSWNTRAPRAGSPPDSASTVLVSNQDRVDDRYREGLSHRLRPRLNDQSLPSADFLVGHLS
jgi:hypothetical protein